MERKITITLCFPNQNRIVIINTIINNLVNIPTGVEVVFKEDVAEVVPEEDVMEVVGEENNSMIKVIKTIHFKMSKVFKTRSTQINHTIHPLAILQVHKIAIILNYATSPVSYKFKIKVKVKRKSRLTVELPIPIS